MNILVYDLGGTLTKCAVMNEQFQILFRNEFETPTPGPDAAEALLSRMADFAEPYQGSAKGAAISMPGMINSEQGFCLTAGALTYLQQTDFSAMLSERLGLPCTIENDGKCAALAEFTSGALKGCTNGAVVILGTAVGGGLILNGKLYKGNRFSAGEFSYALIDRKEMLSYNGFVGAQCGTPGLIRLAAKETGENADALNGKIIFDRAEAGDAAVLKALREYTDNLAVQLYNLNALLDLDLIAIGGGISRRKLLHTLLAESVDSFMKSNPMSWQGSYIPTPKPVPCAYSGDSNLIGALSVFLSRFPEEG